MWRMMFGVAGALLIAGSASPATADAQMMCGDRSKVADTLEQKYSETPVSIGLASNGSVIEVFAAPSGTWTIIMTQPTGQSCLIGSGENWVDVPKKISGTHM